MWRSIGLRSRRCLSTRWRRKKLKQIRWWAHPMMPKPKNRYQWPPSVKLNCNPNQNNNNDILTFFLLNIFIYLIIIYGFDLSLNFSQPEDCNEVDCPSRCKTNNFLQFISRSSRSNNSYTEWVRMSPQIMFLLFHKAQGHLILASN